MGRHGKCDICGRKSNSIARAYGVNYCPKHYKQKKKYGYCLDTNPRTSFDRNEIHIKGDVAYMDLYDKQYNVIGQTIIDTEDLPKVQYIKWRKNCNGYVVNTPKNHKAIFMHRVILGKDVMVDHINHNTLDNRKSNLRQITKSQNQMNSNYKGVYQNKNTNKYISRIKLNGQTIHLGYYIEENEAYFARWYVEKLLFKEYAFPKEKPEISEEREAQIKEYVLKKVQRL